MQFLPFVLIIAVFWFLVLAPMRRQQKKRQQMIDALKAGDKVVTNGGIHGTVKAVDERIVQLRIADKLTVQVERAAIARIAEES